MMDFGDPEIMKMVLGARFCIFRDIRKKKKKSKNRCKKGLPNPCFWLKNRRVDAPKGPYLAILLDFGGFEKTLIFRCRFGGPKNRNKSSLGASRADKDATNVRRKVASHKARGIDGPRAAACRARLSKKKRGSRIEKQILTRRGSLARRFF